MLDHQRRRPMPVPDLPSLMLPILKLVPLNNVRSVNIERES